MSESGYEKFLLRFWLRFREEEHPSIGDIFGAQSKAYWALVALALVFFAACTVLFGWNGILVGLFIGYLSAQLGMAVQFKRSWPIRRRYLNWQAVEADSEAAAKRQPENSQASNRALSSSPQTRAVGVDRCKAGWLAVIDGNDGLAATIYPNFRRLVDDLGARVVIAVDMPIGLTDRYPRRCEVEARSMIGLRGASVFSTPVREVFSLPDYPSANARHKELTGKGFSKQAHAVFPPIREIDSLLRLEPELQERLFEVHREPLAKKDAADDDILDALIALWSARRIAPGTASRLPARDERDAHGLLMAMWY